MASPSSPMVDAKQKSDWATGSRRDHKYVTPQKWPRTATDKQNAVNWWISLKQPISGSSEGSPSFSLNLLVDSYVISTRTCSSEPHVLVGEMDLCCFVDIYHLFPWWLVAAFQRKLPEVCSHGEQTLLTSIHRNTSTSLCSTNVYAHRQITQSTKVSLVISCVWVFPCQFLLPKSLFLFQSLILLFV